MEFDGINKSGLNDEFKGKKMEMKHISLFYYLFLLVFFFLFWGSYLGANIGIASNKPN